MDWVAHRAFEDAEESPAAVFDRGDVGKEAITRVIARDARTLTDRVHAILDGVQS